MSLSRLYVNNESGIVTGIKRLHGRREVCVYVLFCVCVQTVMYVFLSLHSQLNHAAKLVNCHLAIDSQPGL